jgi:hypothetical protein
MAFMDEQILARLEKIELQLQENSEVLRKLHTAQKRRTLFTVAYWGIIILIALGALVAIRPMLEGVLGAYGGALEQAAPKNELQSLKELQDFLKE